jgi:aryl-alcohol dehydrogenase-like predicted oxidoreductase
MTFGEEMGIGSDEAECRQVYDAYREAGGNFIDTANIYNAGTSERMLSGFIASDRDEIVLASKCTFNMRRTDPNSGGNHRKSLMSALNATLERLDTDYLDLLWVHGWDFSVQPDVVMRTLDDIVRSGRALHLGISNAPAWIISEANALARERGQTPFSAMQLQYNLVERSIEPDYFDMAQSHNMALTTWGPLASGLLTGKYNSSSDAEAREGARLNVSPRARITLSDKNMGIAEELARMATDAGCSSAQMAIAWQMQRSAATVIPIIGARRLSQLEDNLAARDVALNADQVERLDALAPPLPRYPASLLINPFYLGMLYGDMADRIVR